MPEAVSTPAARRVDVRAQEALYELRFVPVAGEDYVNVYGRDVTELDKARQQINRMARFPSEKLSGARSGAFASTALARADSACNSRSAPF